MTQQVVEHKGPGSSGHKVPVDGLIAGALLVALLIVAAVALGNERRVALDSTAPTVPTSAGVSALPNDGRTYFTEPYWEAARVAAGTEAATGLSALPNDGRAYFTEPYWEAARVAAGTEAATGLSALPNDGRTYFTEPYWEAARTAVEVEAGQE